MVITVNVSGKPNKVEKQIQKNNGSNNETIRKNKAMKQEIWNMSIFTQICPKRDNESFPNNEKKPGILTSIWMPVHHIKFQKNLINSFCEIYVLLGFQT